MGSLLVNRREMAEEGHHVRRCTVRGRYMLALYSPISMNGLIKLPVARNADARFNVHDRNARCKEGHITCNYKLLQRQPLALNKITR